MKKKNTKNCRNKESSKAKIFWEIMSKGIQNECKKENQLYKDFFKEKNN